MKKAALSGDEEAVTGAENQKKESCLCNLVQNSQVVILSYFAKLEY